MMKLRRLLGSEVWDNLPLEYPELYDRVLQHLSDGNKVDPKLIKEIKWKFKIKGSLNLY